MSFRYLMLSDKARLDETASIWVINNRTVRIPVEELEYLCFIDLELRDKNSPLKRVFSDLEYTLEVDCEFSIQSTIPCKKEWLAALQQFQLWILRAEREIWGLFAKAPKLNFYNEEYARMIAAIGQIVQESIRLDEPIDHWLGK